MTTEEIRELIAGIGVKIAEVAELQKRTEQEQLETWRAIYETDRQLKEQLSETDRQLKGQLSETDRQLKGQLSETDRQLKEQFSESDRQLRDQMKETDRQITRLGQQLGRLGEKFGGFTEGMAFPSMKKLLGERFRMDVISTRDLSRKNGHSMELDVLAYSKSPEIKEAYIVEVKSLLREDGLQQMKRILRDSREFFPVLADKKVYGVIAAVDFSDDVRAKVLREGIYLARIHDEEFELEIPEDFKPRAF